MSDPTPDRPTPVQLVCYAIAELGARGGPAPTVREVIARARELDGASLPDQRHDGMGTSGPYWPMGGQNPVALGYVARSGRRGKLITYRLTPTGCRLALQHARRLAAAAQRVASWLWD